ncbi:MAG: hypothetical protein ACRDL1_12155 [Solirubrobacterales bacterium]
MSGAARSLLIAVAILAVLGALISVALLAFARSEDQGLVPDRIQRAASPDPSDRAAPDAPAAPPAQCPAGVAGCRTVSGRIAYVEVVDPDGDGDAHFVLADTASVTGPGITVVDVRRDLRPNPLPGSGDHLSAAGPVATGSFGQSQIEAVAVGG